MYKRGTVILVPFPFTDLSGNKVRPAVIISDVKLGNDVVVLFLTSQVKVKIKGVLLVKVEPTKENGLKVISSVVCSKIATLDAKVVLGELGTLPTATLRDIDTQLKKVLGL